MSPDLINIFLEFILREAMQNNDPSGLEINNGHYTRCCYEQLIAYEQQLDKIDHNALKYGMEIRSDGQNKQNEVGDEHNVKRCTI